MDPLICEDCSEYLSHAPVFLRAIDGGSLCSVCAQEAEDPELMRNRYYEVVAQHWRFPCKYESYGCGELMLFSPIESEEHPHEVDCKYKAYLCPLDKIGECEWQGPVHEVYLHFLRDHPLLIYDNPCVFNHDPEFPNTYIFLVFTAGQLFLLQGEVKVPEGRIYHSVRVFGKATLALEYKFELYIQKNGTCISRIGDVLPINNMEVTEDTSITTKVSNLLDLMGSFDHIQFSINIRNIDDLHDDEIESYCHVCNGWKYLEHGVCNACRLNMKFCPKRPDGCCQLSLAPKIEKHETLYCNFTDWCEFCDDFIYPLFNSKSHHYLVKHEPQPLDVYANISRTHGQFLTIFFKCEFGIILCNYYMSNKKLEVHIVTPFSNMELRHFQCKVFIENPVTGNVSEFALERKVHAFYDWLLHLQKGSFAAWNNCFNIKIEITRV